MSDHYAIFGNPKTNSFDHTCKHSHQTITYRSFKHFEEIAFVGDFRQIPWESLDTFVDLNECVQVWNMLLFEIVNKHAPLKQHE